MLVQITILINILLYSAIASQPLFYWIALANASRNLSAGSYIELRQMIDREAQSRLRILYYACLASNTMLLAVTAVQAGRWLFISALIGWIALVLDIIFSTKGNVPINGTINQWKMNAYPDDWQAYRHKWFRIYRWRQLISIIGFSVLLLGITIGSR